MLTCAGGEAQGSAEKAIPQRGIGPGAALYEVKKAFGEEVDAVEIVGGTPPAPDDA